MFPLVTKIQRERPAALRERMPRGILNAGSRQAVVDSARGRRVGEQESTRARLHRRPHGVACRIMNR